MIPKGRLARALGQFVSTVMARVDRYALYECQVVSQNADGTLELQPLVQGTIPGQSNVPIRYQDPGQTIQVAPGTFVLFGWRGGDLALPYAALWVPGGAGGLSSKIEQASQKLALVAPAVNLGTDPGQAAVGRVGDEVQVTIPTGAVIVSVTPGPPAAGVPNPAPITLTGRITSGATRTKAS